MANKLICIVGMAGSGKSEVADFLREKGFGFVRFGQITLDEVKKRGLAPTEANERPIREAIRAEHGPAAFAILNMPKFDKALEASNVVGDGLYSWSEYKVLKEKYGQNIKIIAVFSPPQVRYERLSQRKSENDKDLRFRSFTKEEAKSRDYAEIENIEKAGPIAMADYTIINTGSLADLKNNLENILNDINQE